MGCKWREPWVSAAASQSGLPVSLFPGVSPDQRWAGCRGHLGTRKGDAGQEVWVWGASTHFGGFLGSLQWRQRLPRTSRGAPSSGGQGSSPVCTQAPKAKGTAGRDGNCPVWVWSGPSGGLGAASGGSVLPSPAPVPGPAGPLSLTQPTHGGRSAVSAPDSHGRSRHIPSRLECRLESLLPFSKLTRCPFYGSLP